MKREDDQQLWDLLGRNPAPGVSPFFARNVLRRLREQPTWAAAFRPWFRLRRLIPLSGAVAAIAGAVFMMYQAPVQEQSVTEQPPNEEAELFAKIDPQDYEVVADLDDLLASDENNLWDESSSLSAQQSRCRFFWLIRVPRKERDERGPTYAVAITCGPIINFGAAARNGSIAFHRKNGKRSNATQNGGCKWTRSSDKFCASASAFGASR